MVGQFVSHILGSLFAVLLMAGPVGATNVPDALPLSQRIGGTSLILNGYGVRERWFLDVYGCALYAPKATSSVAYLMDTSTPTAIRVRVNLTPPADPPARWEATFRAALTPDLYQRLTHVYESLTAGDVLLFTYAPEEGTRAFLNGRLVFSLAGHGLMHGLLDQWLGPRPISDGLRRALLNVPPSSSLYRPEPAQAMLVSADGSSSGNGGRHDTKE